MNKKLLLLFAALALFGLATNGFGQGGCINIFYFDDGAGDPEPPLGCPCVGGTPFADGVNMCMYWDIDNDGPDPDDPQPNPGNFPSWLCYGFNGETIGQGAGHFATESAFCLSILPSEPDSCKFYLRINSGGCCVTSDVFTLATGGQEWFTTAAEWTCEDDSCQGPDIPPPPPPTNVQAAGDTLCMLVRVTWDHVGGENLSGFRIYDESGFRIGAAASARSQTVAVFDNQVHQFSVTAFNASAESDPEAPGSFDTGRSFVLDFAPGEAGDLSGWGHGGQTRTVEFVRPNQACADTFSLWLLNANGTRWLQLDSGWVIFPTDPLEATFTLPEGDDDSLRLLLEVFANERSVFVHDTTESLFALGLDAGELAPLPKEFSLSQNFPNPFNPETRIEFAVPYQADVKIEVYNISGQLVTTLLDGSITAGVHHIAWNGRSSGGIDVSSGLYLYRMTGPGFVQTKKMLLLK